MKEQRKHFYTDQKIQGRFLFGLVTLELILAAGLIIYLYFEVNRIIDDHLYRMHSIESTSWGEILSLLGITMSGFIVANLLTLYLAHLLWARYVNSTIDSFSRGLDKVIAYDFSAPESIQGHHQLLELLKHWLAKEKKRGQDIRKLLDRLTQYEGRILDDTAREEINQTLSEYRNLLASK